MDDTKNPRPNHAAEKAQKLYRQALTHRTLEQAGKTRRLLEELVHQFPGHAHAHNDLGALCFQKGELARAREHLELAIKLNPADADIRSNLADVYKAEGESDNAGVIQTFPNARSLTVIALCPGDDVELEHALQSLARQLHGRFMGVKVLLLRTPDSPSVVQPPSELNLRELTVADSDLAKTVLELIEAEPSELFGILRGGWSLAPGAIEEAVSSFEFDPKLAALASVDQEPGTQEILTITENRYRSFREHRVGLLVVRKSMLSLCRPCLEQNLHSLEWMLKAARAAFALLNLGVRTDPKVRSWPLKPSLQRKRVEQFVWHTGLSQSLLELSSSCVSNRSPVLRPTIAG